jgi:ATPase
VLDVPDLPNCDVDIYVGEEYLFTATVGRHGEIKIRKNTHVAAGILDALDSGEAVVVRPV